jgi:hypothetical protein
METSAHWIPRVTKFRGVGVGIALWLVGDEIVMPELGLTEKPGTYSLRMQANALGEYLCLYSQPRLLGTSRS